MTKIADLKKRLMDNPEFRKEYGQADAEFTIIEEQVRAKDGAGSIHNKGQRG